MRRETEVVVSDALIISEALIAYHDVTISRYFVVVSQWIEQPAKHLQSSMDHHNLHVAKVNMLPI